MDYTGIFDTHAHYDDSAFDEDRDSLIQSLPGKGISLVVDPACDLQSCQKTLELSSKYDFIYSAVGVHPEAADSDCEDGWLDTIENFTHFAKVVAIGEIGLDYHYDTPEREIQKSVFEQQIKLSVDLNLPVIIHDREAHQDTLEIVKKYRPKGIIHCFSGSAETAKEFVSLGMYIGFTGSITFKNANKILLAAASVPDDRILIETDCPYMAPVPFRGKRNDSGFLFSTAEKLAEIRGTDPQRIIDLTRENGKRIYSIK